VNERGENKGRLSDINCDIVLKFININGLDERKLLEVEEYVKMDV
jgi:hypothetical protein